MKVEVLVFGGLVVASGLMVWLLPQEEKERVSLREITPGFPLLHERTVAAFVSAEGFGYDRVLTRETWEKVSAMIDGDIYTKGRLQLVGATSEEGDRIFDDFVNWRKKEELFETTPRELNPDEKAAMAVLRAGLVEWTSLPPDEEGDLRVMAPIRAAESCLKCHEAEVGEMLGAFDYRLWKFEEREGD